MCPRKTGKRRRPLLLRRLRSSATPPGKGIARSVRNGNPTTVTSTGRTLTVNFAKKTTPTNRGCKFGPESGRFLPAPFPRRDGAAARRKPRLLFRLSGVFLLRFAERQLDAPLFQLPPRFTRFEPDDHLPPVILSHASANANWRCPLPW